MNHTTNPQDVCPTGDHRIHTPAEAVQYWYDAATERLEERNRLRAVVARIGQMADAWEQRLPEVIRTPAVVSAIRAALEADADASRVAAEEQPADVDEMAASLARDGFGDDEITGMLDSARGAVGERPSCAECGHPHAAHRPGDDPVTPGECSACHPDDARHDHQPTVEEQAAETQDGTTADKAAVLLEIATTLDGLAETDMIRKRRSLGTARRLLAGELRKMAAEQTAKPETHSCRNCEGIDPDTCLTNPDRTRAAVGEQPDTQTREADRV